MATVSRIARVAMRISSAAIEVGLENASHTASTTNSARSRASAGSGQFAQRLGQFGEALVDDGHQQSVEIAEVVLHHAPGHSGAFGDVPDAGGGEALVEDAADGLVDDQRAGAVGAHLAAVGGPSGCD